MKPVTGFIWIAVFLIACGALSAPPLAAARAERLALTIAPGEEAARMTLQEGRYRLTLPLTLRATIPVANEGHRITGARLIIKDEGQEAAAEASRVPVGANSWIVADSYTIDGADHGPLAQNARAACAAAPVSPGARRASMLVPVVWFVTSGRFGFVRLAAGGLQPDADMLADAAFYGDQQEEQVEASIAVTIDCPAEAVARGAEADPESVQQGRAPAAKMQPRSKIVEKASPSAQAGPADAGALSVAAATSEFTCEGGMVRETLAGPGYEVCLCPGHTARRQTAERSFVCERRFARRR